MRHQRANPRQQQPLRSETQLRSRHQTAHVERRRDWLRAEIDPNYLGVAFGLATGLLLAEAASVFGARVVGLQDGQALSASATEDVRRRACTAEAEISGMEGPSSQCRRCPIRFHRT